MSITQPKRTDELESGSTDEKSPNQRNSSDSNTDTGLFTHNKVHPYLPKRVSELPPLESSDEEDNLNCAILNDSFLLTPSKNIDDSSAGKTPIEIDQHPISAAKTVPSEDAKLNKNIVESKAVLKRNPLTDRVPQKSSISLFSNLHQSNSKSPMQSDSGICTSNSIIKITTLLPTGEFKVETDRGKGGGIDGIVPLTASPHIVKTANDIITPRIKFQVSALRNNNFTTNKKSREEQENEFKSQKILFATPLAVQRPQIRSSANDSISLVLDDTPIKSIRKDVKPLSPIKENNNVLAKKSSDRLFANTSTVSEKAEPRKENIAPNFRHTIKETIRNNEKIFTINGKEYSISKKIGSGGSSAVFLAKQLATGKDCAVKCVHLDGDATLVEGYLNETKLLAKLQGNENVVALYDYAHIPESRQLFMIMEKGDCDLNKILQTFKTDIPLYNLISFWYQMLQCVNYIHENGVIHSDLKPANFLMIDGRLKLIDFGIASNISIDSTSIIKFSQAGTFNYISPEALIDTSNDTTMSDNNQPKIKISKKSDVWSLGCILYLLLYKKTPFAHIKNIYNKVTLISDPNTKIEYPNLPIYYPSMLLEMLKKCLHHNPKKRASVAELLEYPFDMIIPINKSK